MPRRKRLVPEKTNSNRTAEIRQDIGVIILIAIAFLSLLSLFGLTGDFGQWVDSLWQSVFGWVWWLWPFVLILISWLVINKERLEIKTGRWVGLFLFFLSLCGLLHLFASDQTLATIKLGAGGGILGYLVGMPLQNIASFWGALIILLAVILISLLIFSETTLNELLNKFSLPEIKIFGQFKNKFKSKENYDVEDVGFEQREIDNSPEAELINTGEEDLNASTNQKSLFGRSRSKPQKIYSHIDLPLDLLNDKSSKPTSGDITYNQKVIQETLQHFRLDVEMGDVSVGPTVTQYTFKPAQGVKVSQITTLSNDLALALAAHPIRIEAPIPGKSLIGVEVPNQKIALVTLKEVLSSENFTKRESNLMMALGKDVAGQPQLANLDKMPHLLVAGATNSGKTVCLNAIIISLLYQNQPDELKLILVDPKQVEMVQYNNIPHLLCPVITDVKKTIHALRWSVKEMEDRFSLLAQAGKRNIQAYNAAHPQEKMPYLIIVIDELADLMAIAAAEIEQAVIRLAQKSRAVGIHLVLATQRPSVNIITGLIKANITSRIAFSVASSADSRTILDFSGAEKLLGRGDMLFLTAELSKPKRLQGAFLSDNEIERVVAYLKEKGEPEYNTEVTAAAASGSNFGGLNGNGLFNDENGDELLNEAKELVVKAGKASASYLQRRLRIGYARAARLLDLLEEQGIVGPGEGAKPREVLVKNEKDLDYYDAEKLDEMHEKLIAEETEQNIDGEEKNNEDDQNEI